MQSEMPPGDLKIELQGRSWDGPSGEARSRCELLGEMKLEMIGGKLLLNDDARLLLAGLLIENIGAAAIVKLGDPEIWKSAIKNLD